MLGPWNLLSLMAREESAREDLLRDATAFSARLALRCGGFAEEIFVGFRPTGDASFYVGEDPVYHFNARGELRRAYGSGDLIKAEGGRLVVLHRERPGGEVQLVRRELSDAEAAERFSHIDRDLARIRAALEAGDFTIRGQVSVAGDLIDHVRQWLAAKPATTAARSPRVG